MKQLTSIATWTCLENAIKFAPSRPVIVLCGTSGHFDPDNILDHYANGARRWDRLTDCPYWISLDIFYIFTNWDGTLDAARNNLVPKARVCLQPRLNTNINS